LACQVLLKLTNIKFILQLFNDSVVFFLPTCALQGCHRTENVC